jgi:hypothetical protein
MSHPTQISLDVVIEDALVGNPEAYLYLAYEYKAGTATCAAAWLASLLHVYQYLASHSLSLKIRDSR